MLFKILTVFLRCAYYLSKSLEVIEMIISDVNVLKNCKHFLLQQIVYIKVEYSIYFIMFSLHRKKNDFSDHVESKLRGVFSFLMKVLGIEPEPHAC